MFTSCHWHSQIPTRRGKKSQPGRANSALQACKTLCNSAQPFSLQRQANTPQQDQQGRASYQKGRHISNLSFWFGCFINMLLNDLGIWGGVTKPEKMTWSLILRKIDGRCVRLGQWKLCAFAHTNHMQRQMNGLQIKSNTNQRCVCRPEQWLLCAMCKWFASSV